MGSGSTLGLSADSEGEAPESAADAGGAALRSVRGRARSGGAGGRSSQPAAPPTSSAVHKVLSRAAVSPLRLAPLVFVFMCAGCVRLQRTRECRDFAKLINRKLDAIETSMKVKSPTTYRTSSRAYADLSKEVRAAMKPLHPELASEEFAQVFDSAAHAAETYAVALENKDDRQQGEMQRELERLARQEHSLVLRVNAHCENP